MHRSRKPKWTNVVSSTSKHGVTVGSDVGSEVVGSEVVGSEVVGSEVVGSEVVGSEVVGSEVVGSEVVGAMVVGAEVVGSEVVGSEVVGSEVVGALDGACEAHCRIDERQTPLDKNDAHAMLIGSWQGPEPVAQLRQMKTPGAVGGDGAKVGTRVTPGSVGPLVVGGVTGATVVGEAVDGGAVGVVGAGAPHFSILDRHSEVSSVGPGITNSAQVIV